MNESVLWGTLLWLANEDSQASFHQSIAVEYRDPCGAHKGALETERIRKSL